MIMVSFPLCQFNLYYVIIILTLLKKYVYTCVYTYIDEKIRKR